ncbi:hypothetical protein VPHD148_0116 [Vibrio phage D148]
MKLLKFDTDTERCSVCGRMYDPIGYCCKKLC